jgi:hypothetical protein
LTEQAISEFDLHLFGVICVFNATPVPREVIAGGVSWTSPVFAIESAAAWRDVFYGAMK